MRSCASESDALHPAGYIFSNVRGIVLVNPKPYTKYCISNTLTYENMPGWDLSHQLCDLKAREAREFLEATHGEGSMDPSWGLSDERFSEHLVPKP